MKKIETEIYKDSLEGDNAMLRLHLQEEYGMNFDNKSSELSPELENKFLRYMEAFEKEYAKNEQVKLYDFLGTPPFKRNEDVKDEELMDALTYLQIAMAKKLVRLDVLSDVAPREIYRFITEELFNEEVDNISIPGLNLCFIYEEFYPEEGLRR